MTHTSHRLVEPVPPRAPGSRFTAPALPREFDGIPGLRNSQALRDWTRATADLDRAKQRHSPPETITELSRDVARAYARLQALSARHR
jgi:hypothetical protein